MYVPAALAVLGIFTSSVNWISGDAVRDPVRSIMRQVTFAYNLFFAPFLFLPAVYLRMRESRDHAENLWGVLFCLVLPSTLILTSAKWLGTVANLWEASLHVEMLPEGFLQYQLGKVLVTFVRTDVGFILAALICASTAIVVSRVKSVYRWLAVASLISNVFLLLGSASFGSGLACLCGLGAIFYAQFRKTNVVRTLVSLFVIALMLLLTYALSPPSVKAYLAKRYEHRVVKADTDRFWLWARAVDQLVEHPEGVGLTMEVGDRVKSFIHNEYLVYAVGYGLIGGLGYAALVLALLISFFRRHKKGVDDPSGRAVCLAGLGVMVVIAVNSMTDHMNPNRWYFNVMWSVIWYSYFCSRPAQVEAVPKGDRGGKPGMH